MEEGYNPHLGLQMKAARTSDKGGCVAVKGRELRAALDSQAACVQDRPNSPQFPT